MIKEILVHLDGSDDDESRILHADRLAIMHGAHIRGLHFNIQPEAPVSVSHYTVRRDRLAEHLREAKLQRHLVEHALELRLERLAGPHAFYRFDCTAAEVPAIVATQTRTADLLVVRTPYRVAEPDRASEIVEAALFGSGRGVFVIPEKAPTNLPPLDTILVAWTDSREAANAVTQAMPFLRRASRVIIAVVDKGTPVDDGQSVSELERYLAQHGITAGIRRLGKTDDIAAALFTETEKTRAGMIVAGAYGHSRLREWVLGGVTRDILTKTPVPALLAH
ncbi:universal stress protein [Azospirillum sp. B4]|uniref:universal stress protein n=1 Tax=Azospirillum sp. B4 TaxID=95605 RepID=UPI00034764C8|nr:universal stress protein [Azospirillum sp. B4]